MRGAIVDGTKEREKMVLAHDRAKVRVETLLGRSTRTLQTLLSEMSKVTSDTACSYCLLCGFILRIHDGNVFSVICYLILDSSP